MPDLSANRPLPLPDEPFTEDDVALVDETIDVWFSDKMLDCWPDFEPAARLVLAALASAGRLLPPSAERQWRLIKDEGTANESVYHPAERDLVWLAEPGDKKLSRWVGSWVEMDGGTKS